MIKVRRDADIYDIDGGWFRARWHFSFDRYEDPEHDSFGAMRVFNDDRLKPGAVWPLHPHRDVEGLTYVVEGTFGHQDNVGGPFGPLPAGSVQRMTLGSGALHSELNASETEPMRFIQIWILPDTADLPPAVEQRVFTTEDRIEPAARGHRPRGRRCRQGPPGCIGPCRAAGSGHGGRPSHRSGARRLRLPHRRRGLVRRRGAVHRRRRRGDRCGRAAHPRVADLGAHPRRRADAVRAGRDLAQPDLRPSLS